MSGGRLQSALILATLAAAGPAAAAPHEPPPVPEIVQVETPELSVWVKRLPGRFDLAGVIHHVEYVDPDRGGPPQVMNEWTQGMGGKADCIEFADQAPGLQCVINLVWPEVWNEMTGKASLGGVSDLTPAMVLAGVDPDRGKLRFLMVTKRGFGYPGWSELSGNSAVTRPSCVDLPGVQTCEQKVQITAPADARLMQVVVSTKVRFLRYKKDRDPSIVVGPGVPPYEWLDELLEVSFSVKRDETSRVPDAGAAPGSTS